MSTLAGKVALVTGGGRGLGLGMAERLLADGAAVALMGRDHAVLAAAAAQLSGGGTGAVSCHAGDVSSEDDVERVLDEIIDQHGHLDIVVNNAGIADEAAFLDATKAGWDRVIATNLTGPFLVTQRSARKMQPGGAIVNIASIDAYGADGPYSSYVAAKAGLLGLTKAAATELAAVGIRVNSVSPGWTLTQMAEESVRPATLEQMKTAFARVPLKRMVTVAEVAAAVAFLVSPAASGITGIDVVVDGGTLANLFILETLPDGDETQEHR